MLQLEFETTKDTIIKLRQELVNINKEINIDKNIGHSFTLKVIETSLEIIDDNNNKYLKDNNIDNYNENKKNNENNNENRNELKEEKEKEKINNNSNNSHKLPPKSNHISQSPKRENKNNKKVSYINTLKQQITFLKQLFVKKDEEIKEIKKCKTTINYSNLQNIFEKNFNELTNIKKQNKLLKTKIEDATNLLYIEKEGKKNTDL